MRWIVLCLVLAGCGGGPLSFLTGGGPNVAANVQAGAENRQSAVSVERQAPQPRLSFGLGSTVSGVTQTTEQAETRADTIQTYNANPPLWFMILFALGWLLPSPGEIWRGVVNAFRRK